ncbi:MAG: CoA-binding protein [Anaerolineae bacterium]
MPYLNGNDDLIRQVLSEARVIAVVGQSNDHYYTSYQVYEYLEGQGYGVYGVNPYIEEVNGETVYPTLAEVPVNEIDIVNVFRKSVFLSDIVDEAIALGAKTVWAQLGVFDEAAAEKAHRAGLSIATNLCIRTEHERLFGK